MARGMRAERFSGRAVFSVKEAAKLLMIPQVGGIERFADTFADQVEVRRLVREV